MVMRYSKANKPEYLWVDDLPKSDMDIYLSKFYRVDPFFAYWREHDEACVFRISDMAPSRRGKSSYFRVFQRVTGFRDGIGVFLPALDGSANVICFESRDQISDQLVEEFQLLLPLLLGLHDLHEKELLRMLFSVTSDRNTGGGISAIFSVSGEMLHPNENWQALQLRDPSFSVPNALFMADEKEHICDLGFFRRKPLRGMTSFAPEGFLVTFEQGEAEPPVDVTLLANTFLQDQLTPREREIVLLAIDGVSSLEIALQLGVSEGTIRNHRKRLYKKLNIVSERELLAQYIRHISVFL